MSIADPQEAADYRLRTAAVDGMFFDSTILSSPITGVDRFHYFIRTVLYTNIRLRLMTSLTTDRLSLMTGRRGEDYSCPYKSATHTRKLQAMRM